MNTPLEASYADDVSCGDLLQLLQLPPDQQVQLSQLGLHDLRTVGLGRVDVDGGIADFLAGRDALGDFGRVVLWPEHVNLLAWPQRAAVDTCEGDECRPAQKALLLLVSLLLNQFEFRKFTGEARDVVGSVLLFSIFIDSMPGTKRNLN